MFRYSIKNDDSQQAQSQGKNTPLIYRKIHLPHCCCPGVNLAQSKAPCSPEPTIDADWQRMELVLDTSLRCQRNRVRTVS